MVSPSFAHRPATPIRKLLFVLSALAFLVTGAAQAAVTITRSSSPIFYIDTSNGSLAYCAYAGYTITNNDGVDYPTVSATINSFTGGVVGKATNENGVVNLGAIANGQSKTAYFYLKASGATATPQQHTVTAWSSINGSGTSLASQAFSLTVEDTIEANANKVISTVHGPDPSTVGGILTITFTGETGTIGAAKVLSYSPASYDNWRADALQLISAAITFSGANTGTVNDQLLIPTANITATGNTGYTAVYRFRLINTTTVATPLSPFAYISSGTQIKHTATSGLATLSPVQPVENFVTLTKSASTTSLPITGGVVTYTLTVSNSGVENPAFPGGNDIRIDRFVDILPSSPAAVTYVSGSTAYAGSAIGDPSISGQTLTWNGSFVVPASSTRTLTYQVNIPGTLGTYVNQATGYVENTPIDTTLDTSSNDPATVSVTVSSNQPPTTTGISNQTGTDGSSFSLATASAFSDPNGDTLSYSATGLPTGLSIHPTTGVISGNLGALASASGPYSVTVTVSDGTATTQATFTLTVTNPAPTAADTAFSIHSGGTLNNSLSGLASDPDGDTPLAFALGTDVAHGSLSLNADGSFSYSPTAGYAGSDSFTYSVTDSQSATSATYTVSLSVTNTAPGTTGISDQNGTDAAAFSLATASSFSDADNDTLAYSATGLPTGLSIHPVTGMISGTLGALASASGPYSVTVTVSDGVATAQATFSLAVSNPAPTAVNDSFNVHSGGSLTGQSVAGNDSDADGDTPLAFALGTGVAHGSLTFNADGSFSYSPTVGYAGPDSFTYTASDAQGATSSTATVSLTVANQAPTTTGAGIADVTKNDTDSVTIATAPAFSDADGDTLTYSATGLPAGLSIHPTTGAISGNLGALASASGPYSVTVSVSDGVATAQATFSLAVSNPAPIAADTACTVALNGSHSDTLAGLASDPDGDTPIAFALGADVAHGSLTLDPDGSYSYTPANGYSGPDSFTYTAADSQGAASPAYTVAITVTAANNAPSITNPGIQTDTNGIRYIELYILEGATDLTTIDATDADGDAVTLSLNGGPDAGLFVLDAGTQLLHFATAPVYNPGGDNRYDVVVEASDGNGGSDQVLFIVRVVSLGAIQVVPVDPAPFLDRQTGLFKQRVVVTNLHDHAITGFRIIASGLDEDIVLFNASGQLDDGSPYLQYAGTLAASGQTGSQITLTIEFLRASLVSFPTPAYSAVAVLTSAPPEPEVAEGGLPAPRIVMLPAGNDVLIEFTTTIGNQYAIEYSADMVNWTRVLPLITANANVTQWIDNGPPKTASHPSTVTSRLYRVVHLAP